MRPELPAPIARFDDAQRRSIALLRDVVQRLEAGMSERDVYELAETRLDPHGFTGWFHRPEVAFGRPRRLLRSVPSARRRLAPGDLVTLDFAPADAEAYGDFGYTLAFGEGPAPAVVDVARDCCRASCGYASRWKTIGEIRIFAEAWAVNHRMRLAADGACGHRVPLKEGWVAAGFPRTARLATLLMRNRVHRLNPVRMDGLFALRPEVTDGVHVAAFEEIVYVHEDTRVVLGRDDLAAVGTLTPG